MRTILIYFLGLGILASAACSKGNFSLTHHAEIQQGNVITQDMVNRLSPGMTKRQVQMVMGTPAIVDVFQQDRWDYPYTHKPGRGPLEERRLSLYFQNNQLVRTHGDMAPADNTELLNPTDEKVSVVVPYQDRGRRGILNRFWRFLTFRNDGNETK